MIHCERRNRWDFRSNRSWLPAVLLLCATSPIQAAVVLDGFEAGGAPAPFVQVVKLNLRPARAPVPALKYRLLPELGDLKPGNAVLFYYRAFSPEWQFFRRDKEFDKALDKWYEDRTKPPPPALEFVKNFSALRELDIGARRAHCDWEMIDRLRKDGITMLLPDIQSFRTYSLMLAARARFEMLDKKYDKALYTLQTGFTLSRHISEGPTLIQSLVGNAMTNQMTEEIEQLIQQPGAPNLYWALSDLPTPYIDLRKPLQGEKIMIDALFPGWRAMISDLQAKPLSPANIDDVVKSVHGLTADLGIRASREREFWWAKLTLATLAAKTYPEARKFLLDLGHPQGLVDAMPVAQVALLYEVHNFDRLFDDMIKWYGYPYPVMRKGMSQAVNQLKQAKADVAAGTFIATLLLPAVDRVIESSYRTDRKLASLRCVEAIRLYAAAHEGKLPASLKDIEEVPVPLDPMTGNSFEYKLVADGAVLSAPPPPASVTQYSWRYEIKLQP